MDRMNEMPLPAHRICLPPAADPLTCSGTINAQASAAGAARSWAGFQSWSRKSAPPRPLFPAELSEGGCASAAGPQPWRLVIFRRRPLAGFASRSKIASRLTVLRCRSGAARAAAAASLRSPPSRSRRARSRSKETSHGHDRHLPAIRRRVLRKNQDPTLDVEVEFIPAQKDHEKAPDFRMRGPAGNFGAAWQRTSATNRQYLSCKIDDPAFHKPIYASLVLSDDGESYVLIWTR
jgi:uncharacterized protein (DUF736 family)